MRSTRILIVEDEPIVQLHLQRIVAEAGHRVAGTAATGEQALEAAERERPELVLMDIQLSGELDGVQVARALRDRHDCAVVFATAYADPNTVARTECIGASGYIIKPFTNAEVRAAISTALAGRERAQRDWRRRERSLVSILGGLSDEGTGFQSSDGAATRMLLYSHDTFGLGHLQRSRNLIRALLARDPGLSILLVTGSPVAHRFELPKGADYVKLPAVRKVDSERYEARSLSISDSNVRTLRSNLLLRAVRDFAPDVFVVDHSPVGMAGEVLPTLEWLAGRGSCTTVLGLRDIIDEPRQVVELWREQGIYEVLRDLYDHVLVYGAREVYDPVRLYELPEAVAARTRFTHYLCEPPEAPAAAPGSEAGGEPLLAVSIGGGDGAADEVIGTTLEMLRRVRGRARFRAEILTGPLLPAELEQRFRREARGLPVALRRFVSSTTALFRRADLVVSTAGYNTSTQILAHARRAVLIPRLLHRREQLIRASRLAALGLVTCLPPGELGPESLFEAVRSALASPDEPLARGRERNAVPLDGAERAAAFLAGLPPARRNAAR